MSEDQNILTTTARLVSGHPLIGNHLKDDRTKQPLFNEDGSPKLQYFVGVAIPKTDKFFEEVFWPKAHTAAMATYSHLFDAQGNCKRPDFSFKFIDGDGYDSEGKPYAEREGYAGCWIIRFVSNFAPKVYSLGAEREITDKESIQKGYYVRVAGSIKPHGQLAQSPGIYVNLHMVELVDYGEIISSGPNAKEIFGGNQAQRVPGAPSMPPSGHVPPQQNAAGAPPQVPQGAPQVPNQMGAPAPTPGVQVQPPTPAAPTAPSAGAPTPQPPQPVSPAHDMVAGAVAPAPQPPAPQAPTAAPNGVVMSDNAIAQGITYEGLKQAGWTDEQMHAQGYITDYPPFG